jgi:hypothetical protein
MKRLAVLILSGCGGWFEPPPPPSPEEAHLAWAVGASGIETTWLSPAGAELSRHSGLAVAWDGGLWRLITEDVARAQLDCTCVLEQADPFSTDAPPTDCQQPGTIEVTTLRGPGQQALVLSEAEGLDPWVSEPELRVDVLGQLGPHLLLSRTSDGYSCGAAHGFHLVEFLSVDLRTPAATQAVGALLSDEALAELAPEAMEKAREALMVSGEVGEEGLLDPDAPLKLTALLAEQTDGGVQLTAQLTAETCYACGDGLWGDYSRSHRLVLSKLPPSLAAFSAPPPPVVQQWASSLPEGTERWGYSVLRALPAILDQARATLP